MNPLYKTIFTVAAGLIAASGATGPALAEGLPERVGVTVGTLGNPFFVPLVQGAEDRIKEAAPDADVTVVGADYDLNKQSSQIDSFISSGATLMILNAVDSAAVAPAVKRAKDAGMTVAAVDVSAAGADLTVRTDNTQAGRITCDYLAQQIGGKGDFVIINGPPVSSIIDRVTGCKEALANYPDISILSDNQDGKASRDGGFQVMLGLLTRFPHMDAVFGANDPTAIGAELAAKQTNRSEMIIGGVDGSPDFLEALQKDGTLLVASASQDPYHMAWQAADLGLKVMEGEAPPAEEVLLQTELVTRDNAADWKGWDTAR
ncbi:ABC transporter substrate-binding protein [Paracoccus sp. (in: a-proteobacteria)]|uniref:ABC transporter substrate-binding protein n=1 Tax=Paracoccus sp. TaxID=267 RepID=UPI003A87C4DA